MKILIYISLILAPVLSFSQVSVYTKAQSDSAIAAAIKKIVIPVPPAATVDYATVQKMIDASLNKLDSVIFRTKISTQASFINLDTLKVPINTAYLIDLTVTANQISTLHSAMCHYEILLTNNNGIYYLERTPYLVLQDGLIFKGTGFTFGLDSKYGLVLFATPGTASPVLWTEIIGIKKISK